PPRLQGWQGRVLLLVVAFLVAVFLIVWRKVEWPYAIGAVTVLTAAALIVRRTSIAPIPPDPEQLARRAARLTDLTIEGLIAALPAPAML
ncbi:hypothetical protein ABTE19_20895, partial [Acinetobacter baumannii]